MPWVCCTKEMRRAGSLILSAADAHKLPAGGALAVDQHGFSAAVTEALESHPLIEIRREEIAEWPSAGWSSVIVATGPLTAPTLADAIRARHRRRCALLLRRDRADRASRDPSTPRLPGSNHATTRAVPAATARTILNCPLDETEYHAFINALLAGEKTEFKELGEID